MDSKQLRKLTRIQLLEMLIQISREADQLRTELEETRKQLDAMKNADQLAEIARKLSELMAGGGLPQSQPQPATALECPEAEEIVAKAKAEAATLLEKTRRECDEMVEKAKQESRRWWEETSRKMDVFYKERPGLREMLTEHYRKQG